MALLVQMLCVCFLLFISFYSSEAADVYMASSCGQTINMDESGGVLDSQSGLYYSSGLDCQLLLEAAYGRRILLTFKEFDVEGGGGTNCQTYDYLEIYEGMAVFKTTPDLGSFCGSLGDTHTIVSTSNYIKLRFKTDSSITNRGFLLAYTSFYTASGTCDWGEFKCANSRCIDIDLQYNGYDNCGDSTDEGAVATSDELSPGLILVIIVVCLVCLVLFGVSCACIWQRVCKSTPRTNPQTPGTGTDATQPKNNQQVPMQPTGQLGQYPGQPIQNPGQPVQYQPVQYQGQPVQYQGQPVQYSGQPIQYPGQPIQYPGQPGQYPTQPGQYPTQPVQNQGQPTQNLYTGQPPAYPGQPAPSGGQPVPDTQEPVQNGGQPAPSVGQSTSDVSQPTPVGSQPTPNPQETTPTTEQPAESAQEPAEHFEKETHEN